MNRRTILAVVAACFAATVGRPASAEPRDAEFWWHAVSYPNSCLNPLLAEEGDEFFSVNGTGIPTYHVRDSGNMDRYWEQREAYHHAPFRTSLFDVGSNLLEFGVYNASGDDTCNNTEEWVWLLAPGLTRDDPPVFHVRLQGTAFEGATSVDMRLSQIDPELAESIARLRDAVRRAIERLERLGPGADHALHDIERYEDLLDDLQELIDRGFDGIDSAELDALIEKYGDLAGDVLEALRDVIEDFKTAIEDLRAEIERISQELQDRVEGLDDFSAGGPTYDPGDFDGNGGTDLPEVEVPEVGDEPWDPEADVYGEQADAVIALLTEMLDAEHTTVVERVRFLETFNAWRASQTAIEAALVARAVVSTEEYGAFLRAKGRVLAFVQRWVDEFGWYRDAPVHPETRRLVQLALATRNPDKAARIQLALNAFRSIPDDQGAAIFGMLVYVRELGIAVEQAHIARLRAAMEAKESSAWDSVASFLGSAAELGWDVAVAMTPLGDVIDACEALTGKEGCRLISGRNLTWGERAFAGVGLFMWGSSHTWRRVASKIDDIACPFSFKRAGGEEYKARTSIACTAKEFIGKLDEALSRVKRRGPGRGKLARDPVKNTDGTTTYFAKNGPPVHESLRGDHFIFDRNGTITFEPRHLFPVSPPKKNEAWVEFFCNRDREIGDANVASGFPRAERHGDSATWHHTGEFKEDPVTGKLLVRMQLATDAAHKFVQAPGAIAIGKQVLGAAACRD